MWQKTHAKISTNTASNNTWVVYTFAVPLSACFGLGLSFLRRRRKPRRVGDGMGGEDCGWGRVGCGVLW